MGMWTVPQLESYLHREIPLAAAMEIRVADLDPHHIRLTAPLAANRNPHETAFGGSLATLAVVTGWALLHVNLVDAFPTAELVISSHEVDYIKPVQADFSAECDLAESDLAGFLAALPESRSAEIELSGVMGEQGHVASRFRSRFHATMT